MKKLSLYVFLVLMFCNTGFAETKDSVNYYTKQNYKIIKHTSMYEGVYQVFTLKRKGHIIICTVKFDNKMNYRRTSCIEP